MKKKVFFIISSFAAGGAERVFWLLCQAFDKSRYDVTVVLLNTTPSGFSLDLQGLRVVDLKSVKASKSFFRLLALLRRERPYAIYSTGSHINMLVSFVSTLVDIPYLIARSTNIPTERIKFTGLKSKAISLLEICAYRRFEFLVCQSEEMRKSWASKFVISPEKLVTIPNPISDPGIIKHSDLTADIKKLIIVAKMSMVKGHKRLLQILNELPANYRLTIAGGDGGERVSIEEAIDRMDLTSRVDLLGQINNVTQTIAQHDLLVLSSYTEGFPNVVLEALSVGTPVVTFRVGGVSDFIVDGFNGYIVEQGDVEGFKSCVIKATNMIWNHPAISKNVQDRFALPVVARKYEQLIEQNN